MKTIVTILRTADSSIRIYEVPAGVEVKEGDRVFVEYGNAECPGVATQNPIEVEDGIVEYFTDAPLRKITAIVIPIAAEHQDDPDNGEN